MADIIEKFKKFEVNRTNDIIREILTNISKEYNINLDDLLYKYLINSKQINNTDYIRSKINSTIQSIQNKEQSLNKNDNENNNGNNNHGIYNNNNGNNISSNDIAPDKTKCYGKVKGEKQCSRIRKDGKYYCGTHSNNLPYGTYLINENNKDKEKEKENNKYEDEDDEVNNDKKVINLTFFKITYLGQTYYADHDMDKVYKSLNKEDLNKAIGYIDSNKKLILYS